MLKVMTLNLNYYGDRHGSWESRRALIAEVIELAQPHIVALQAVRVEPQVENDADQASKTRSKLTIEVAKSSRALVKADSGP